LQFTSFSGSSTGKTNFRKRIVVPTQINDIQNAISSFALAPNPANNATQLVLTSNENKKAYIAVYDLQGRMVFTAPISIQQGLNAFTIPLHTLSNGQYVLHVKGQGISVHNKIVVTH
jgi:hypothetical protein